MLPIAFTSLQRISATCVINHLNSETGISTFTSEMLAKIRRLFVNLSAMSVMTLFQCLCGFSNVLFLAFVTCYQVNDIFCMTTNTWHEFVLLASHGTFECCSVQQQVTSYTIVTVTFLISMARKRIRFGVGKLGGVL